MLHRDSQLLEMVRLYKDGTEELYAGEDLVDRRILRDIVMAGPQSSWVNMIDAPPSEFRANNRFVGYGTSWLLQPFLFLKWNFAERRRKTPYSRTRLKSLPERSF